MPRNVQDLILKGLKGLPPQAVSEIASYVFFLRKKYLDPEEFDADLSAMLKASIGQARKDTLSHLEKEFESYEKKFPRE